MSQYLAGPNTAACLQTVKHTGTAVGEEVIIGGVKCYISYPPSKSTDKILLFFCDVYGPWYINNQLLMDFFAQAGYLVVSPDYFEGDQLEQLRKGKGFDFMNWGNMKRAAATAIVEKWIPAVKEKFAGKGYCAAGYCFGGLDVVRAVGNGDVTAGAVAHPSRITEDDLRRIKSGAIFFSCAETDHAFPPASRHTAEAILASTKQNYHFQLFSGVTHGFATRSDLSNENERWAKETSAWSMLGWFDRWLK